MSPRQTAEEYRNGADLPPRGFVIVYRGIAVGWTNEISTETARQWKRGCLAVPEYRNSPMFIADGEDATGWGGASRWEKMDPKYEPTS